MPYFVIGMPLIIIFAAGLGLFPTSGMLTAGASYDTPLDFLADLVSHLVLPVATISLGLIGGYSILMRSSVTETRAEDYIATARAKGLTDGKILRSHAIPNALLPAVTLIAINLGYVVGGAITAGSSSTGPGGDADGGCPELARLPGAAGDLPVPGRLRGRGQLRGRHRLRVPRPAGASMTAVPVSPAGVRRARWRLRVRNARAFGRR
jgi:hypothetical protein